MRAVLTLRAKSTEGLEESLFISLMTSDWVPIDEHHESIYGELANKDENNLLFRIYDEINKTIGLARRVSAMTVELRLFNRSGSNLRNSCENIVDNVPYHGFDVSPEIKVYSSANERIIFLGKINRKHRQILKKEDGVKKFIPTIMIISASIFTIAYSAFVGSTSRFDMITIIISMISLILGYISWSSFDLKLDLENESEEFIDWSAV